METSLNYMHDKIITEANKCTQVRCVCIHTTKSLGVCVHACVHTCTSISSYINCSSVEVVHGHFSYNRIKLIHLTASKFTKANTNVDTLRVNILMVQFISPWNRDENRPAGLALESEVCVDFCSCFKLLYLVYLCRK